MRLGESNELYVDTSEPGVGLGTASPQTNMHLYENTTDTEPGFELEQVSTGDATMQFSIVGDAYAVGIENSDSDQFNISYASTAGNTVLVTNDRLTMDSASNVGIGTAPSNKLTVGGDLEVDEMIVFDAEVSNSTSGSVTVDWNSGNRNILLSLAIYCGQFH